MTQWTGWESHERGGRVNEGKDSVKKIVLFGTGIQAQDVHLLLTHDSDYEVVAFTADRDGMTDSVFLGLPVVPFDEVEDRYPPDAYGMHICVQYQGLNKVRAEKYAQAKAKGYRLVTYISPRATTWPGLEVGDNCIIGPNSTVYSSCKIGDNVLIGTGCIIPHNTTIGDHCFVAAGVVFSGWVTVEPYCYIGTGAVLRNNITLGRETVVGAGALILENTKPQSVYMGKSAEVLPITSDKLRLG